MKYFWCAAALLLALGLGCALAVQRVGCISDEISALLEAAQDAARAEDMAETLRQVDRASVCWERAQGFLSSVLRHAETDELSRQFESLRQYVLLEDREEAICRAVELAALLRHLKEMEQPYYYNFL